MSRGRCDLSTATATIDAESSTKSSPPIPDFAYPLAGSPGYFIISRLYAFTYDSLRTLRYWTLLLCATHAQLIPYLYTATLFSINTGPFCMYSLV